MKLRLREKFLAAPERHLVEVAELKQKRPEPCTHQIVTERSATRMCFAPYSFNRIALIPGSA